jgi:hypothetical protein
LSWKRPFLCLLCSLPATIASARDGEFLPELKLRLSAARYAPSERDFGWAGWVGGDVGLFRAGKLTGFGSGDVETIVGSERRSFDANQANYHLALGLARSFGKRELGVFFSHVSRHRQDRSKPEAVDWNTLGVRLSGVARKAPLRYFVSAGHTTLASLVGYGFEAEAGLEVDLVRGKRHSLYVAARLRGVTAEASEALPRDGFVDVWLEGGVLIPRGARGFRAFLAYEHRNDVYVTVAGARDRALLGLRFGLESRSGAASGAP